MKLFYHFIIILFTSSVNTRVIVSTFLDPHYVFSNNPLPYLRDLIPQTSSSNVPSPESIVRVSYPGKMSFISRIEEMSALSNDSDSKFLILGRTRSGMFNLQNITVVQQCNTTLSSSYPDTLRWCEMYPLFNRVIQIRRDRSDLDLYYLVNKMVPDNAANLKLDIGLPKDSSDHMDLYTIPSSVPHNLSYQNNVGNTTIQGVFDFFFCISDI